MKKIQDFTCSIPSRPGDAIMDFVLGLSRNVRRFDSVVIVVDGPSKMALVNRFSKMAYLIPC